MLDDAGLELAAARRQRRHPGRASDADGRRCRVVHAYHLIPAGASKARAVARHMQARGYSPEECIAVGDSREDMDAAEVVGTFWLVANALERDPTLARDRGAPGVRRRLRGLRRRRLRGRRHDAGGAAVADRALVARSTSSASLTAQPRRSTSCAAKWSLSKSATFTRSRSITAPSPRSVCLIRRHDDLRHARSPLGCFSTSEWHALVRGS